MIKTTFRISKMDCPSGRTIDTAKLEGMDYVHNLKFDIADANWRYTILMAMKVSLQPRKPSTRYKTHRNEAIESMDVEEDQHLQRRVLCRSSSLTFSFLLSKSSQVS